MLGKHFPTLPPVFREKVFSQLETAIREDNAPIRILDDFSFFSFVDPDSSSHRQLNEPYTELVERALHRAKEGFGQINQLARGSVRPGFEKEPHNFDLEFLERVSNSATIESNDELLLRLQLELRTIRNYNCLHAAVCNGHEGFISIFVKYGGDVNQSAHQGWTALHEAAYTGHIGCAAELLKYGALTEKISTFEGRDWTPLVVAVVESKLEMLMFLLSQGADPWTPDNSFFRRTPAHRAVEVAPQSLKVLLAHDPHLVHARDTRLETPLHSAASCGVSESVKILADAGADLNATDRDRQTPLHKAWKHMIVFPLYKNEIGGRKDFIWLLVAGLRECRELLIERGADQDARDAADETPSVGAYSHGWTSRGWKRGSLRMKYGSGIYSWDRALTSSVYAWFTGR